MSKTLVPNLMLASDVARPNLLQNGGFEVWSNNDQTITGQSSSQSNIFGPSRWQISGIGTDSLRVAAHYGTMVESGGTAVSSIFTLGNSGGNSTLNQQFVHGTREQNALRGKTVTFSARVAAAVANSIRPGIYNGTSWVYGNYHSGSNAYETLIVTTTLPNNSNVDFYVAFNFTATGSPYIDSASLVVGLVAPIFSPPIAYPDAVPNDRLATDVGRVNQLVNGGFEQWQRGNGPFNSINQWGPDRWQFAGAGGDTFSVSKDTTNFDIGSAACAVVTFTKGSGATALTQPIPKTDYPQLTNRAVSLSARVRSSTPNACHLGILPDGSNWKYNTYSGYCQGTGVYETLTVPNVVLSGSTTNWQIGIWFDTTSTVYIDNVMLVVGSIPADYVPLHQADDLSRCRRYYELQFPGYGYGFCLGSMYILGRIGIPIRFWQQKPITPTVTVDSWTAFQVYDAAGSTWRATTSAASGVTWNCTDSCELDVNIGTFNFAANTAPQVLGGAAANVRIEANP